MLHPAVFCQMFTVSTLLLDDALIKMCCYRNRLVFSCCF